ncbi:hypothetical protein SISSUDRAFT_1069956 [Sistotremastrum suecicum HHB10207 ss-3]|uniref:Regulator of volume decrease after cellular swelling-domain-containing protein n=1 Tax=Sistotremastrum suecicum HHB10207 ss-3 TaxID=1314776 RepID=A0A166G3V2_9AGAM|nr:hypothetical protein SISSUDRAFT_1069956 [Sistotremastrum suecicum HHB10207 ss-3]
MSTISLISELPSYISPEQRSQLSSSTPESFSDILPVLRHTQPNVSVKFDPLFDGFSTEDSQSGTLYVIESVLVFLSTSGKGVAIPYPAITLHAISRTDSAPSLYCQLDEQASGTHETLEDEDEVADMRELHIIPSDSNSLDAIFEALSICAALHPDPDTGDDLGDELGDDAFTDADESRFETFNGTHQEELSEVGRVRSDFLNNSRFAPY